MPPVCLWGTAAATWDSVAGTLTCVVPATAQPGDTLIFVAAVPNAAGVAAADGWEELGLSAGSGPVTSSIHVFRRVVEDEEPPAHVFPSAPSAAPQPLGFLLVYRGLDLDAAIVGFSFTNLTVSGTSFVAPARTLAAYSDLLVCAYYSLHSPGVTWTPAANTTARATLTGPTGGGGAGTGGSLLVVDRLPEAAGSTGTETAIASAADVGVSISLALKAKATVVAPSAVPDIAGALGLATIGV